MTPTRSTTCSPRSRRGLTLIEVVAAIAILGTVLVGVVLSRARHTHQLALSQRRHAAADAADKQITAWWTSPGGVPVDEQGTAPGDGSLRWRTRYVDNAGVEALGARALRIELYDAGDNPPAGRDAEEPLLTVDLVVPDRDHAIHSDEDEPPTTGGGGRR